jgi:hypothetical protein
LLVVSLIVGRRAVPIYWHAYDAAVLEGRMKRYERAVIRRAVTRVIQAAGRLASPGPLCVEPDQCHDQFAAPRAKGV